VIVQFHSLRLLVSFVLKDAFSWNVSGRPPVVTTDMTYATWRRRRNLACVGPTHTRTHTHIYIISEDKARVDFNASKSLVERADSVVEILDISRTRLLIDALEAELEALAADEGFRRRLSDAYYDDRVDYDTVEAILGREDAMRMKLLRASIDRTPAIPQLEDELPSDDAFYDGELSEWTESESSESDDESHA
jgi:hypothetical protein